MVGLINNVNASTCALSQKPHTSAMSRCFSILDTGFAAVHCYFFNELRTCLLVQKRLDGRGRLLSQAGEDLFVPTQRKDPTLPGLGSGWRMVRAHGPRWLSEQSPRWAWGALLYLTTGLPRGEQPSLTWWTSWRELCPAIPGSICMSPLCLIKWPWDRGALYLPPQPLPYPMLPRTDWAHLNSLSRTMIHFSFCPCLLVSLPLPLSHFVESIPTSCLFLNSAHSPVTGVAGPRVIWRTHHEKGKPKIQVLAHTTGRGQFAPHLLSSTPASCSLPSLWPLLPEAVPAWGQHPGTNLTNCREEKMEGGVKTWRPLESWMPR